MDGVLAVMVRNGTVFHEMERRESNDNAEGFQGCYFQSPLDLMIPDGVSGITIRCQKMEIQQHYQELFNVVIFRDRSRCYCQKIIPRTSSRNLYKTSYKEDTTAMPNPTSLPSNRLDPRHNLLTQRNQRRRVRNIKRRKLSPQFHADPIPKLDRGQRIQSVIPQRFPRLHGLAQAQHRHKMSIHDSNHSIQDGLVFDGALDHEEEGLDFLGTVFAIGALGAEGSCGTEGAEARVDEEFGRWLLGDSDAGDELGGRGAVDGGGLLEDGETDDFVEEGFVDGGPCRGVEGEHQIAVFAHVADVLDGAEIHAAGRQSEVLSVNRKGVEEDVGGCVVGLSFLAYDT